MVDIVQWRVAIGLFSSRGPKSKVDVFSPDSKQNYWSDLSARLFVCAFVLWGVYLEHRVLCLLTFNKLNLAGDVELNPGPSIEEQFASLNSKLDKNFGKLDCDIKNINDSLLNLRTSVNDMKTEINTLKEKVTELENREEIERLDIDANAESVAGLSDRVCALEDKLESQEQYSRRENVILYGMKESENESYESVRKNVTDLLNKNVKTKHWQEEDILRSHRLGRPTAGVKPRPVIVRFTQFHDKLNVLKARNDLKKVNIGVSNDLTQKQRQQLDRLKDQGKSGYFKNGKLVTIDNPPYQPRQGDSRDVSRGRHNDRHTDRQNDRRTDRQNDSHGERRPYSFAHRRNGHDNGR